MDAAGQYAVALAMQTLDSGGVPYGQSPTTDWASSSAPTPQADNRRRSSCAGCSRWARSGAPALIFNATVANIAASLAGLEMKMRGPNATISQKEASGLAAIAHAADILRHGRARAMIAGGVDAVYRVFYCVHDRFGALSHANGGPEGSRPFDTTRNGFVTGEGGFALLLETVDEARARGANIHGTCWEWRRAARPFA